MQDTQEHFTQTQTDCCSKFRDWRAATRDLAAIEIFYWSISDFLLPAKTAYCFYNIPGGPRRGSREYSQPHLSGRKRTTAPSLGYHWRILAAASPQQMPGFLSRHRAFQLARSRWMVYSRKQPPSVLQEGSTQDCHHHEADDSLFLATALESAAQNEGTQLVLHCLS